MYLYVTAPIDYFAAFMPAEMYYERLTEIDQLGPEAAQAARAYVDHCVELLKGWTNFNDADRANGPFVTALPNAGGTPEGSLIVTLKGQNNGTVYIASQLKLNWLGEPVKMLDDEPSGPGWPDIW